MDMRKLKISDLFGTYTDLYGLHDKYGISTVCYGTYRRKDGGKVYYIKDAFSLSNDYYVKGSQYDVKRFLYNKIIEKRGAF